MNLLFLLLALIMLIMSRDQLAAGAASCFLDMTDPTTQSQESIEEEPATFQIEVKRSRPTEMSPLDVTSQPPADSLPSPRHDAVNPER